MKEVEFATTGSHHGAAADDGDVQNQHRDVENILMAADEVAPKVDDIVETDEVQEVVKPRKSNKRLWIALATLAFALIATLTVVLLTQPQATSTEASVDVPLPTTAKPTVQMDGSIPTPSPITNSSIATTEQPTSAPTMMTRASKVETILAEYSPFNEQALNWLTFVDTWEPDTEDPNHDYLWLERYAMALLFDSTDGSSSWRNSDNWKTSEPVCKWYFKSSNECPGPITSLNLQSNGLKGSLPPVIWNLSLLTSLSLELNELTSSIPSSIENLSLLTSLNLHNNQLTSSIPSSIGNLSLLTSLHLWGNKLTSSIPSSIGNLSQLTWLELAQNQLTSSIPSSIGNLSLLTWLVLSENQLTSSIPSSIENLSLLKGFFVYNNTLTGSIPSIPSSITWCGLENNCFQNLGNGETAGCVLTPNCAPA